MTTYESLMIYAANHCPTCKKGMPAKRENSKFELVIDGNVWKTVYTNNEKTGLAECRSYRKILYRRYADMIDDEYDPFGRECFIRVTDRQGNIHTVEG